MPLIDLRAGHTGISEEIRSAVAEVIASQQFVLGRQNEALEHEIAAYCDTGYGVGLANGTDALTLALAACGVSPGDEVIVPAFTFIATATAVIRLGARPVFADIDPGTFNLDPAQVEAQRTPRTKAVIPVHLYGAPADMNPIREIAARNGIAVIEDNAQAIGARYHGQRTGSLSAAAGISFYPTKNLGAYGDAGMLLTNSEKIAEQVRRLRNHGQTEKYTSSEPGWNSRLDEIQAAVLGVKLRHLDDWTAKRQAHARRYNALFAGLPGLITPQERPHCEAVYHLYTVRIESGAGNSTRRDRVREILASHGVSSAIYYPIPLPFQPLFASHGHRPGEFPEAERAASQVLSLPLFPELTENQIERVAEAIATALKETS